MAALVAACTGPSEQVSGFTVTLLQPQGAGCAYTIAPVELKTLHSLNDLTGTLGQVVTTPLDVMSRDDILDAGYSLRPVDTSFIRSGDTYFPANYDSLVAASLYYAIELGYDLFSSLDPSMDLLTVYPTLGQDTFILHEAQRSEGTRTTSRVSDNAEFMSVQHDSASDRMRNFIFSFPNQQIQDLPLAVNMGVMTHEFSHLVFDRFFYQKINQAGVGVVGNKPTEQTLSALDEGMADYIGYMTTEDPGFFNCSFPEENRDLSKAKSFTTDVTMHLESSDLENFDPHEGGAVFAAINYEIGQALGDPRKNAKLVAKLMSYLVECPETRQGSGFSMNFSDVAACHARLATDSNTKNIITNTYRKYLGAYGGSR